MVRGDKASNHQHVPISAERLTARQALEPPARIALWQLPLVQEAMLSLHHRRRDGGTEEDGERDETERDEPALRGCSRQE